MADENNQERSQAADAQVSSAAKTGKAISKIAVGAATGGIHGAALATAKASKKWLGVIAGVLLLPVLLVVMLPSIIFGSLFSDGTDAPNGITDDAVMTQRMYDLNTGISTILSEGLSDVLARIDADFSASDCDEKEVNNPYGADIVFNANHFIAMYCASKDSDAQSISKEDMEAVLRAHKAELYT